MQTVLVLAHLYCFAICESEDIFVSYRTTIGKLFSTIKLVMRTSSLVILIVNVSFCATTLIAGCYRSDEGLSLCVLVSVCRFISASPWWAQLNSWKQTTHKVCLRAWSLHWLFPYWASQFCLGSFIIFTEIFKYVDFCVSVSIIGVSVRAWFDALKRDSHAESVRLDRYDILCVCVAVIQMYMHVVYYDRRSFSGDMSSVIRTSLSTKRDKKKNLLITAKKTQTSTTNMHSFCPQQNSKHLNNLKNSAICVAFTSYRLIRGSVHDTFLFWNIEGQCITW
jgi:hypothetical protein